MRFRRSIRHGGFRAPIWKASCSASQRLALAGGRDTVERRRFGTGARRVHSVGPGLEKELQELAAVLECTQLSFLPAEWQEKVAQPDGRTHLQERMVAIRQLMEET